MRQIYSRSESGKNTEKKLLPELPRTGTCKSWAAEPAVVFTMILGAHQSIVAGLDCKQLRANFLALAHTMRSSRRFRLEGWNLKAV